MVAAPMPVVRFWRSTDLKLDGLGVEEDGGAKSGCLVKWTNHWTVTMVSQPMRMANPKRTAFVEEGLSHCSLVRTVIKRTVYYAQRPHHHHIALIHPDLGNLTYHPSKLTAPSVISKEKPALLREAVRATSSPLG
jgi:hypothetical protein